MVAMILVRTLTKDITKYNRVMTDEEKAEEREETGWKLVHADVFRPPTEWPMLFCVLIGTGMQVCVYTRLPCASPQSPFPPCNFWSRKSCAFLDPRYRKADGTRVPVG